MGKGRELLQNGRISFIRGTKNNCNCSRTVGWDEIFVYKMALIFKYISTKLEKLLNFNIGETDNGTETYNALSRIVCINHMSTIHPWSTHFTFC